MAYRDSVVRIRRFTQVGSAAFIAPDLILTAGHVIEAGGREPVCGEFSVTHPITRQTWRVTGIRVHSRWRVGSDPSADIGLLRVAGPAVALLDVAAFGGGMLTRYGIPANPNDSLGPSASGMVSADGGFFYSDDQDMQIPQGASGGPLLSDDSTLVGIGTGLGLSGPHGYPIGVPTPPGTSDTLLNDPDALVDGQ
jgi:S1-C subfamily serine protease